MNCRYLKPYDEVTLYALLADHTQLLTVEEGTVVNGFGAYMARWCPSSSLTCVWWRTAFPTASSTRRRDCGSSRCAGSTRWAQLPGAAGEWRNARDAHGVTGSAAGGAYASAGELLAFDEAIRTGTLLDPKMTGWFLEVEPAAADAGARARGGIGIAGGAPGTNALLETDEHWAVAVVGNLDPPASVGIGQAIKKALAGK